MTVIEGRQWSGRSWQLGGDKPAGLLDRLQTMLELLPGVGPKSAERIAHHLLAAPTEEVLELAEALRAVKERLRRCAVCCAPTEEERCGICQDGRRDGSVICVVEQPRDLSAFERMGTFRGLYHVLHGRLAPLEGVGPDRLTIDGLVARARGGDVREVILATNPTLEGDGTALYIAGLVAHLGLRITRLARGLPAGSVLEFANSQMLADALEGRNTF
ncbi:MAG: recombination mediator RecR [Planctomycetota bacterium]|nr:recombination mediator RecR [Planctomycetota bacterium]